MTREVIVVPKTQSIFLENNTVANFTNPWFYGKVNFCKDSRIKYNICDPFELYDFKKYKKSSSLGKVTCSPI